MRNHRALGRFGLLTLLTACSPPNAVRGRDIDSGTEGDARTADERTAVALDAPADIEAPDAAATDSAALTDTHALETGTGDATDTESGIARDGGAPDGGMLDGPVNLESDVPARAAVLAAAPTASRFGWQSLQTDFIDAQGNPCTGQITIAVSDHAVCYENAAGQMACAGLTYTTNYGTSFALAGQADVDQILLSPSNSGWTGNAACIHNTHGQIFCFGNFNSSGQFGNGTTSPSTGWVQWGSSSTLARMATGTWGQICAIDSTGAIFCSGAGYGSTPAGQLLGTTATSLWLDPSGTVLANDKTTFRVSDGYVGCQIVASGLHCIDPIIGTFGTAGTVVTGGGSKDYSSVGEGGAFAGGNICWGDSSGHAWCNGSPAFTSAGNVLYVAANYYTSDVCVVSDDGSIWCSGKNSQGELGTGDTMPVTTAKRVQPPGSVSVDCK